MDEWQRSRMTAGMGVPKQSPLGSKRDRRMVDPFLPRTRCPCVTFTPLKIRRPWVPWHFEVLPREGGEIHRTHWNPYVWNEVSSMFPPWINSSTHAIGTPPGTSKVEFPRLKKNAFFFTTGHSSVIDLAQVLWFLYFWGLPDGMISPVIVWYIFHILPPNNNLNAAQIVYADMHQTLFMNRSNSKDF